MNDVKILARLTRDPEVRFINGGTAVCKVGIAYNERFKGQDGEWKERGNFFDVTIWGKRGEAFAKFHRKGSQALFEGSLRYEQWDDKQTGQKRSRVYISAHAWHFVGPKSNGREGLDQGGGYEETIAPSGSYAQRDAGFTPDAPSSFQPQTFVDDIDDTPF